LPRPRLWAESAIPNRLINPSPANDWWGFFIGLLLVSLLASIGLKNHKKARDEPGLACAEQRQS
jgi:CDP-diglyceride synthetase